MTEDTKPWWQSRTVWVQIVAFLFAIGAKFEWWPADVTQEDVILVIMAAVAIISFILRLRTTTPIAKEGVVGTLAK